MNETECIRQLLRAFAEVRDGPFYRFWLSMVSRLQNPLPKIEFRLYQVAHSSNAHLVVGVSAVRKDQKELSWSVGLQSTPETMLVRGCVEVSDDARHRELFERSQATTSALEASELVRAYAQEVCSQDAWLDNAI